MWRSRIASGRGILYIGTGNHLVPEIATQLGRGAQVDFSPDKVREFPLHVRQAEVARPVAWLELHQYVNVAVRAEAVGDDRAEQGQLPNMVAPAELGQLLAVKGDLLTRGLV
jgi:hypothetical protein